MNELSPIHKNLITRVKRVGNDTKGGRREGGGLTHQIGECNGVLTAEKFMI